MKLYEVPPELSYLEGFLQEVEHRLDQLYLLGRTGQPGWLLFDGSHQRVLPRRSELRLSTIFNFELEPTDDRNYAGMNSESLKTSKRTLRCFCVFN